MGAEIVDAVYGLLTVRITGRLTQPELAALQKEAGELLRREHGMRVLILVEDFEGWGEGGEQWGDVSFQSEFDQFIEKLAIVGERRWEDLVLIFVAKGLRRFPVEYFEPADLAAARAWLNAAS